MISYPIGSSGQTLLFEPEVVQHLLSHRQLSCWTPEAGGQLFARITEAEIRVEQATGPRPTDKRKRRSYVPDRKAEQVEIDELFTRDLHFIGDWHTHPEELPRPSSIDLSSVKECVKRSDHDLRGFILVIVGTGAMPHGLFVGIVSRDEIFELHST